MNLFKIAAGGAVLAAAIGFGGYEIKQRTQADAQSAAIKEDLASLQTQLDAVRPSGSKSEQRAVRAEEQLTALEAKVRGLFPSVPITAPTGAVGASGFLLGGASGGVFGRSAASPPRPEPSRQEIRASSSLATRTTHAPFYRRVGFTAEQRARFTEMMVDHLERKDAALREALAQNRLRGREAIQAIVDQVNTKYDGEFLAAVKKTDGDSVAEALRRHQETVAFRGITNQLASALFYSEAPLTVSQADQLVEILRENASTPGGKIDVGTLNQASALAAARAFLSPLQVEALVEQLDQAQRRSGTWR